MREQESKEYSINEASKQKTACSNSLLHTDYFNMQAVRKKNLEVKVSG